MSGEGPSRFKSRFSILSLLPARHPPLQVSEPLPPVPIRPLDTFASASTSSPATSHIQPRIKTRHVDAVKRPALVSKSSSIYSPAKSEYPEPSDGSPPLLPPLPYASQPPKRPYRPKDRNPPLSEHSSSSLTNVLGSKPGASSSPHRRPPPLDLSKTRQAYPRVGDVIATTDTVEPEQEHGHLRHTPSRRAGWFRLSPHEKPPSPAKSKTPKSKRKPVKEEKLDPFDVCEVEPGHQYPSWREGRVSIHPGEVVPRGVLQNITPTIRAEKTSSFHLQPPPAGRHRGDESPGEAYDSVLHNVLLTPTYLGPSPTSLHDSHRMNRRKTLLDRVGDVVRNQSHKWVGKSTLWTQNEGSADRVVREMREREMRDMDRFRMATRGISLHSEEHLVPPRQVVYASEVPSRSTDYMYPRRSPGKEEWSLGNKRKYRSHDGSRAWCCLRRKEKKDEQKKNKKSKRYKCLMILVIVILAALTIGLCTALLTQSGADNSSHNSSSDKNDPTIPANTTSPTTSKSLATCLDLFMSSAPGSPGTYPCSDCVPLLTSATNDFESDLIGGNSTGVGATLQFCALMDILHEAQGPLSGLGWGKDASPCAWNGVSCDSRGRVVSIGLKYPNVPNLLPRTLENIVSLSSLSIIGNNSVPSGDFYSDILALQNLTSINLQYTGLRGDLSTADFRQATRLSTLSLINNANLAPKMPDLEKNSALKTFVMTGQGLGVLSENNLPSSLKYLDLSYNAFGGQVPNFSSLTSLTTLFLSNNNFTSPPTSLPSTLSSLQLTSNAALTGSMPLSLCSSPALSDCDLRGTNLQRSSIVPRLSASSTTGTSSVSRSSASVNPSPIPSLTSCGTCRL